VNGGPDPGKRGGEIPGYDGFLERTENVMEEVVSSSPARPSPSTERSRRHRQRRRRGTRFITVDVNEGEVAALVARGYLPEEARVDPVAIKAAIEVVISDLAFELEQERFKGSGSRF
jgi:hypothetical protein